MKKLILLFIPLFFLLVSCSNYEDKIILQELNDDELIKSVETADSTLLLFHVKFKDFRKSILENDIDRIYYSDVKYSDIKNYLSTRYEDSVFLKKVRLYFENNKESYYTGEYEKVQNHINQVFENNLKVQKEYFKKIAYNGLDSQGRLSFIIDTNDSEPNSIYNNFIFFTILNGNLITINFSYFASLDKTIKTLSSYNYYLPKNFTKSERGKAFNKLKNLSESDFFIYINDDNLKIMGKPFQKNTFEDILSPMYAYKLINYKKIDSLQSTNKETLYSYIARYELNREILYDYELFDKYTFQLLDSISNFKKITQLFDKMEFLEFYENYKFREWVRENE